MIARRYPILIWFLSEDLRESAEWLSNKHLVKTINGCMQALVSARLYCVGIRTPKFYKHYFSTENRQETMDKLFPLWPLRLKPTFMGYKSRISKWCRLCREHYDYVKQYLDILLLEYEYRYKKQHGLSRFLEWLEFDAPLILLPIGNLKKIVVPWKCLNPRHRKKDICEGYRSLYKAMMVNDGIKITDYKDRDVPLFLLEKNSKWLG